MKAQSYTKETIRNIGMEDRGFPDFSIGDCISVSMRIKEEGGKERLQAFEGDVVARNMNGICSTFTVRRIGANSVAVERIFPYYAPTIASITFIRRGDVCRAKLYYMRERIGKNARVKELILTKEQKERNAQNAKTTK